MNTTRYTLMNESNVVDTFGNPFPDLFTFPLEKFKITKATQKYVLTSNDIDRFDLLISAYYGTADYDDIVLIFNQINLIYEKSPGDVIYLPDIYDIETFYRSNSK